MARGCGFGSDEVRPSVRTAIFRLLVHWSVCSINVFSEGYRPLVIKTKLRGKESRDPPPSSLFLLCPPLSDIVLRSESRPVADDDDDDDHRHQIMYSDERQSKPPRRRASETRLDVAMRRDAFLLLVRLLLLLLINACSVRFGQNRAVRCRPLPTTASIQTV